jgi:hypothetical protein
MEGILKFPCSFAVFLLNCHTGNTQKIQFTVHQAVERLMNSEYSLEMDSFLSIVRLQMLIWHKQVKGW